MKLALKVDVDTLVGTRTGVPVLMDILDRRNVRATFLFSVGPDHTGRAIRRVLRPGFFSKVQRTSVVSHYGIRTLLYGTLLPGPDIGKKAADDMRRVAAAGHEVGIHCWDHVGWQDNVAGRDRAWTQRQIDLARSRFSELFGRDAHVHGAAGWQMNADAYRIEAESGFRYASDSRGRGPYWPVIDGDVAGCIQLPTTLPTLDELIGRADLPNPTPVATLAAATEPGSPTGHVFTLHAEIEGGRESGSFDELLGIWLSQGYEPCPLSEYHAALDPARVPRCRVAVGTVPGRSGTLAVQGDAV